MIIENRKPSDGDGEDLRQFLEPILDPELAVIGTLPEQEGASHATCDAVVPASDRGVDEVSACDGLSFLSLLAHRHAHKSGRSNHATLWEGRFAPYNRNDSRPNLAAQASGEFYRRGHGGWKLANASRVLADDGVICVTSADGKWTLGTLWEKAHQVFNNPDGTLACLHSDVMISQFATEESATVCGWMSIEVGNLEAIHEKRLAHLREAQKSEK